MQALGTSWLGLEGRWELLVGRRAPSVLRGLLERRSHRVALLLGPFGHLLRELVLALRDLSLASPLGDALAEQHP